MSIGYSQKLVAANKQARSTLKGVRLGRFCIKHDIPVSVVAKALGVSRMTVYNWFSGVTSPTPELEERIRDWVAQATQSTSQA
jgi:transcriptional regulator with XRE-family HTH domain